MDFLLSLAVYFLPFLFAFVTSSLRQMHMFQLNSYSGVKHCRWMKKNIPAILTNILSILLLAVFYFVPVAYILPIVFLLFGILNLPRKKAKKPLVFTTRVIRMFVTGGVLLLAYVLVMCYLGAWSPWVFFLILPFNAVVYALTPFIIILANFLNSPIEAGVRQYYINDAKKMLRSCPDLKVIGITGSYGKTSMKFFLTTLLKGKYDVLMTPESYNTPMGVVKTIRGSLKGYHQIFVCEMGAKKVREIDELCRIADPMHGIVNSIGPQHLETFKSVENVVKTKFELADHVLKKNGTCFVNVDNEYIRSNKPEGVVTYGTTEDADYYAKVLSVSRQGTKFSVRFPDGEVEEFNSILIGGHNVVNLCGAVAMAHFMGVSPREIKAQMPKITAVPHRLQLLEKGPYTIIDDAFNSNPSGSAAALDTLALFEDFKILVTPGMIELGEKEEELNRAFGRHAAKVCDFVVLVGRKQTAPILAGLRDEGYPEEKIYVADSFNEGINQAYGVTADRRKIILLENDLPDNY